MAEKHCLGLPRSRPTVKEAGEALTEAPLLHTLVNLFILLHSQQRGQLLDLTANVFAEEKLFGSETLGQQHIGEFLVGTANIELAQQLALGFFAELVARVVGNTFNTEVLYQLVLHQPVVTSAQFAFGAVEVGFVEEEALQLAEADVVIVVVH